MAASLVDGRARLAAGPFNIATCPDNFWLWGAPTGERFAQGTGEIDRVWILDLGGVRLCLIAVQQRTAPAEQVAELQAIVDSVDILP